MLTRPSRTSQSSQARPREKMRLPPKLARWVRSQEELNKIMKRPDRIPTQLSESLHHRLNMYAIAASAAGVGALALAVPADAKIIYTPAHVVIAKGQKFQLDINHDGIADFVMSNSSCGRFCTVYFNGFFIGGGSQNQIG